MHCSVPPARTASCRMSASGCCSRGLVAGRQRTDCRSQPLRHQTAARQLAGSSAPPVRLALRSVIVMQAASTAAVEAAPVVQSSPVRTGTTEPPPALPFRIGHGFDLHRLEEGYPLIIGGIPVKHTRGCVAHSDGDVLLHCITDALLGALSLPDIGQLFPDSDPKWKGASSDVFIREAMRLMHERGYRLGNLDATIIAERPKLSPVKEAIRDNLCSMLSAHPSVVNIKAKTHEKVDSLGENRSIACHTVVLLIRNKDS